MINLGIYMKDLSQKDCMAAISQEIDNARKSGELKDASIFFDDIGPVNIRVNAGFFNSTDIWNFTGDLVVFSLECLEKSLNYVNNFRLFYCYGVEPYNTLNMIRTLQKNNIPTIAAHEHAANQFKRLTNTSPIGVSDNLSGIVQTIKRYSHE